jgi:hypothetical protein
MAEEPDTEQLQAEQLARELEEQKSAEAAPVEEETAQHERRAEKAHYLREKLEERAQSEREAAQSEPSDLD